MPGAVPPAFVTASQRRTHHHLCAQPSEMRRDRRPWKTHLPWPLPRSSLFLTEERARGRDIRNFPHRHVQVTDVTPTRPPREIRGITLGATSFGNVPASETRTPTRDQNISDRPPCSRRTGDASTRLPGLPSRFSDSSGVRREAETTRQQWYPRSRYRTSASHATDRRQAAIRIRGNTDPEMRKREIFSLARKRNETRS